MHRSVSPAAYIMRMNCWPQLLGFARSRPSAAVNSVLRSLKSPQLSAPAWPRAESSPCAPVAAGVPPRPVSPALVSSFHNLLLPFVWFGDSVFYVTGILGTHGMHRVFSQTPAPAPDSGCSWWRCSEMERAARGTLVSSVNRGELAQFLPVN